MSDTQKPLFAKEGKEIFRKIVFNARLKLQILPLPEIQLKEEIGENWTQYAIREISQ